MKIRQLQEALSKLDPGLEVICYSEDEQVVPDNRLFVLLDILSVDTIDAEKHRLSDGTPHLKLGKSPDSEIIATIEVTSDF